MLPPRPELLELALKEAVRVHADVRPNGGLTVLTSAAFGGLALWVNDTFFKEHPRCFDYSEEIIVDEFLDQAYRAC